MPKLTQNAALDKHRSPVGALLKGDCRPDLQLARGAAIVCSDFSFSYSTALALATKSEPRPNATPDTTADSTTITTAAGTGTTTKKRAVK